MPAPPRHPGPRLLARIVGFSLLALAVLPAYLTISPAWRPAAARLACALAVAIGCARARAWTRDAVATPRPSSFAAPPPPAPALLLRPPFLRPRDALAPGTPRRRY